MKRVKKSGNKGIIFTDSPWLPGLHAQHSRKSKEIRVGCFRTWVDMKGSQGTWEGRALASTQQLDLVAYLFPSDL